jgi:hypothetical protein
MMGHVVTGNHSLAGSVDTCVHAPKFGALMALEAGVLEYSDFRLLNNISRPRQGATQVNAAEAIIALGGGIEAER